MLEGALVDSSGKASTAGAFNVPPGSVRVTAGGTLLQEGRDYEVDYATGKVRVLNDAILSSGVPINVSYEDNTLFGFQSKTMLLLIGSSPRLTFWVKGLSKSCRKVAPILKFSLSS